MELGDRISHCVLFARTLWTVRTDYLEVAQIPSPPKFSSAAWFVGKRNKHARTARRQSSRSLSAAPGLRRGDLYERSSFMVNEEVSRD